MANEADHIALANRNHAALMVLLPHAEDHPEWVTTISFYKAVQVFEAVFAKQNIAASTGHRARAHSIKTKLKDEHLFKQYNAGSSPEFVGKKCTIPAQLRLDRRGPPHPSSPSHRPVSREGDAKAKAEGALGSTLLQKKNTFGADLSAPKSRT